MAAKKKAPAKQAPAKKTAPANKAASKPKDPPSKPKDPRNPIGDALTRAERAKYGPYTSGSETNYTPGDRSKTLRTYSRVTGYTPRSGGRGPGGSPGNGSAGGGRGRFGGGLTNRGK
jgi:hypothetical protein